MKLEKILQTMKGIFSFQKEPVVLAIIILHVAVLIHFCPWWVTVLDIAAIALTAMALWTIQQEYTDEYWIECVEAGFCPQYPELFNNLLSKATAEAKEAGYKEGVKAANNTKEVELMQLRDRLGSERGEALKKLDLTWEDAFLWNSSGEEVQAIQEDDAYIYNFAANILAKVKAGTPLDKEVDKLLRPTRSERRNKRKPRKQEKEDIRQVHYDARAATKSFVSIEVVENKEAGGWWATCTELNLGALKNTKQEAIKALYDMVHREGYEVSNLPEVMGIDEQSN